MHNVNVKKIMKINVIIFILIDLMHEIIYHFKQYVMVLIIFQKNFLKNYFRSFYCKYSDYLWCAQPNMICDNRQDCKINNYLTVSVMHGICTQNYKSYGSNAIKILCRHFIHNGERWRIYFTLDQRLKENTTDMFINRPVNQKIEYYLPRYHRSLDSQVWLDKEKNLTTNICLCPPSYYGDYCQYQNQRISLTLQFRITSDSVKIPFIIIVSLIDDDSNERIIHSNEQFTYLPMINCKRKYNIYLLY